MIFVGDVAIAPSDVIRHTGFPASYKMIPLCINLEGAIAGSSASIKFGVLNSSQWIDSFQGFTFGPVFIGNNHIHDIPNGIETSRDFLMTLGLETFGAGSHAIEAGREIQCKSGDATYILIGAGWSVIGCVPAKYSQAGVNPLNGYALRKQVADLLKRNPRHRLVVVAHWNYEFERYPQPGHRRLANDLIDDGVYAIIGHHPHVVGPVERYRGRTIAYSLGNWAFSYGRHFGGRLKFPESSFPQIAVELGHDGDTVHHARFSPPSEILYEGAECISDNNFSLKPVFEGATDAEYLCWFKAHRIKKKGLPIYYDYASSMINKAKDYFVGLRQIAIDSAVKIGVKSLRRRS